MSELPEFDRAVAIDPDGEGRCSGGLPANGNSAALRDRIAVGCRGLVFLIWNAFTRNRTDGTW